MIFFRDSPSWGFGRTWGLRDRTRLREGRAGRSLTFSVTCLLVMSLTSSQEIIKNYTFSESSKLIQHDGNLFKFFKLLFWELLTVYGQIPQFFGGVQ